MNEADKTRPLEDATTAPAPRTPRVPTRAELPPDRIGPYRIEYEIGRGGMGVVYLGVDEGDVHRRAAIKVVKRGLDSDQVLSRFQTERQVLAALNHPNIAKVYDAGATNDGRPYFAMEYVDGVPITDYCDRHELSIENRLRLFLQICDAVQTAHRNLVVHRDIKPENILVTDDGAPKLLDFGIAKLLNPEMANLPARQTAPLMRLMTVEYASPEQIRGDRISTISDVYSLGVLLYELMCGHRPYHVEERASEEIQRAILENEPTRPSLAAGETEEVMTGGPGTSKTPSTRMITPESVSSTRETRPERLRRRLSGDIDNIVLLAMRKNPVRRYQSVEQFAQDIERHLNGLPVTARPQSLMYRASKFVGRHRAGVAIAAMIAIVITAAIVAGFYRQVAATDRAAADAERARAEVLAVRSERLHDVLDEMIEFQLGSLHRAVAQLRGSTEATQVIIDKAREAAEGLLDDVPEDDAKLTVRLSEAYRKLADLQMGIRNPTTGERDVARANLDRAPALCRQADSIAVDDIEMLKQRTLLHIQEGDWLEQAKDHAAALDEYGKALAVVGRWYERALDDVDARRLRGVALLNVGKAYRNLGDLDEAEAHYLKSMAIRERLHEEDPDNETFSRDLSIASAYLAGVYWDLDERERAIDLQQQAVELRRTAYEAHRDWNRQARDMATGELVLGNWLLALGRESGARRHLQASIDLFLELGRESPDDRRAQRDMSRALWYIADLHEATGDGEAALRDMERYRRVFAATREFDPTNLALAQALATTCSLLGDVLKDRGDLTAAIEQYEAAVACLREVGGPTGDREARIELAICLTGLGDLLDSGERDDEARTAIDKAMVVFESLDAAESKDTYLHDGYMKAQSLARGLGLEVSGE